MSVWGLMAELRGLPAMGALYCLGAGWLQSLWRPLDIPGTHLPYSIMQLSMYILFKKSKDALLEIPGVI